MAVDGALQYGALGLLAIFVAGFLIWQREREKGQSERQAKSDEWIQSLVNRALEARDQEIETWQSLATLTAEAQQGVTMGLSEVSKQNESHDRKATQRHQAAMSQLSEISTCLSTLALKIDARQGPTDGAGSRAQG